MVSWISLFETNMVKRAVKFALIMTHGRLITSCVHANSSPWSRFVSVFQCSVCCPSIRTQQTDTVSIPTVNKLVSLRWVQRSLFLKSERFSSGRCLTVKALFTSVASVSPREQAWNWTVCMIVQTVGVIGGPAKSSRFTNYLSINVVSEPLSENAQVVFDPTGPNALSHCQRSW